MKLLGLVSMVLVTQLTLSADECVQQEKQWVNLVDKALTSNAVDCKLLGESLDILAEYSVNCKLTKFDTRLVRVLLEVDERFCR